MGGPVGGPDGLFGQSDDCFGYVRIWNAVYMLDAEAYGMKLYKERRKRVITSWPVGRK